MKLFCFKSVIAVLTSSFIFISCTKETELLPAETANVNNQIALRQTTGDSQTTSPTAATASTAGTATVYWVDLKILSARVWYGKLEFTITNDGNGRSAACKALVTFRCNSRTAFAYVDIPSIPGAGTVVTRVHLSAPVPTLCAQSDISYTIVADYYRTVTELNETNNTVSGFWDYLDIS